MSGKLLDSTMKKYRPRMADAELKRKLEAFGAVSIVGPKWCGKTTTAEQVAKSAVYMQDPDMAEEHKRMMKIKPSRLLEGEKPRLIDEWQTEPSIWDLVRYSVDKLSEEGLYILTGSAAIDESKIEHSGAGRIGRMRMHTMSLYESGDSTGEVSISELFSGGEASGDSDLSIEDAAAILVRGGWPNSIGKRPEIAYDQIEGYCEAILKSEVKLVDGVDRDSNKMRLILRSLSRNISTSAPDTTILADIEKKDNGLMHLNTLRAYTKALREIYVLDDLPAWTPKLRSKTTIRTSDTRHLSDPAVAAYFLGASAKDLLSDTKTFGLLFESMVIRDLRVYASSLGGEVFHYRDSDGLEADAIIHLHNGEWGAAEVKLGSGMIDDAVKNLLKIKDKVDTNSPSFLAVITATKYAYTREDGVHVLPIGCLRQ
jgi:predicted AAA+ superfamily ATPase